MFTCAAARRWLCSSLLAFVGFTAVTVWVVDAQGPTGVDTVVLAIVLTVRTTLASALATVVTHLGSFPVVAGVAGAGAIVLWLRTRRLLLPLTLLITVVETAAIVFLIKEVVGRERPPTHGLIGAVSIDGSFPSGHTTNGAVVYVMAALLLGTTVRRRWVGRLLLTAAVVGAVAIGVTRIYLGYHWASDVLGGWLLATAICCAAAFAVCRLGPVGGEPSQPERADLDGPVADEDDLRLTTRIQTGVVGVPVIVPVAVGVRS